MSDSDSDLDFESADEDADFACSTKSTVCQKSMSNDAPSESLSRDGDSNKISTGHEETGTKSDDCIDRSPKQHLTGDLKETVEASPQLQPADKVLDSNESSNSSSEFKSRQPIKSSKPILHQEANSQAADCRTEPQSEESKPPKESVVSRMEKKNLLPKESSVESEKPSNSASELPSARSSVTEEPKPPEESAVSRLEKKKQLQNESSVENEKPSNSAAELPSARFTVTEDSKPPRERVVLRLEKKKQMQNVSSVESEKPSNSAAELPSARSTVTEDSKPSRERVVLRLEKKKQLAKDSPVESEKPSDFVNILKDPEEKRPAPSWGFSSWGSSLLSSAASSVSTFSNQVSQGIGSVIETVESTLGAPPPEELAQTLNEKKAEAKDITITEEEKGSEERSGLLPGVSIWTKVLENTGSKVIMGGLDTLELIGKKTMDMLTEGDPGLRKKRAAFSGAENLSELLKEIKARADEQSKENSEEDSENLHYSQIFDEKQGLVHLEALEMLSKQSQAKFQRLLMRHSKHSEVKKRLEEIKSICENIPSLDDPSDCENFEDFEAVFKKYSLELSFPLNVDNIIKTQRQISERISNYETAAEDTHSPPKEIFQSAICSLADFTAKCIETFHKAAELILVQPNLDPDLEQCATNLTGLTTVMCIEVNNVSSRYHKCLEATAECLQKKSISENADVKTLATNVYVEASNSNNYIQDAYQMLVPVLQVRFLEAID